MMNSSLIFSLIIILASVLSFPDCEAVNEPQSDRDKLTLLALKSQIDQDPLQVLSSWNESSHFCNWTGVTCRFKFQRLVGLNLTQKKLAGNISPHVGNFSFIRRLDLSGNLFTGEIPKEFGNLGRLRVLNMSNNLLRGRIPVNLSTCSKLRHLALSDNRFIGIIPLEVGLLSKLETLSLGNNKLVGSVPSSLGNLTSLQELEMVSNYLSGEVPTTISHLKNLQLLRVAGNQLHGEFPPSLYNLTYLKFISLTSNNFTGKIRNDIGLSLPNLERMWVGNNFFQGSIPTTFSNASKLNIISLMNNTMTGKVPLDLGRLDLSRLQIGHNHLGTGASGDLDFINSLTNCSNLNLLSFGSNQLGGLLPVSIANLSIELTSLYLYENSIHGTIPRDIENLHKLQVFHLQSNHLSGTIPDSLGMLSNLGKLGLNSNNFTGEIPYSIGNMSNLLWLILSENKLVGSIPSSLGNLKQMSWFSVGQNNLTGYVPQEITSILSLQSINVSFNSLTGPVLENIGNLTDLLYIDLSYNKFSGEVPDNLANCLNLNEIVLRKNSFQGSIPNLARLRALQRLDLSSNNFSEYIPNYLASLPTLNYLNLSFNNLKGEVPITGVFSNVSAIDIRDNLMLCGGIPEYHLPACSVEKPKTNKNHAKLILKIALPSVAALSLFLLLIIFLIKRRSRKATLSKSTSLKFFPKISYKELLKVTDGFSSENLIGAGSFGRVYSGSLSSDGTKVAVKVFNLDEKGASKSFMAECLALQNIRHHNLVKVITACSSTDFHGNDFKALVYQLMPNGSLDRWLHPEKETQCDNRLNILQRINIAIDIASALNYLHHECQVQVIHCDLKPHNVLLDSDMVAHIGDFGLARLFPEIILNENTTQFSSLAIKGTIGYAPPEYGMGIKPTTTGDVYSFGILLLEIFTGKRPTDNIFQENFNIHNFVKMAIPERVMEILDEAALCEEVTGNCQTWEEGWSMLSNEQRECLIRILQTGVACSVVSPQDRMSMHQVHHKLSSIRNIFK